MQAAKKLQGTTGEPTDEGDLAMGVVVAGRLLGPSVDTAVRLLGPEARSMAERLIANGIWGDDFVLVAPDEQNRDGMFELTMILHACAAQGVLRRHEDGKWDLASRA